MAAGEGGTGREADGKRGTRGGGVGSEPNMHVSDRQLLGEHLRQEQCRRSLCASVQPFAAFACFVLPPPCPLLPAGVPYLFSGCTPLLWHERASLLEARCDLNLRALCRELSWQQRKCHIAARFASLRCFTHQSLNHTHTINRCKCSNHTHTINLKR